MTDKELLELAAKAAEYEIHGWDGEWVHISTDQRKHFAWNPLLDDGDAFRLEVKLNLHIKIDFDTEKNEVRCFQEEVECAEKGDPYAATRRAIVRAAAEIGKEMK